MLRSLVSHLSPEIEAQEIRSPLTDASWSVAAGPPPGATEGFILVAGSGAVMQGDEDPVAVAAPCIVWLPPGDPVEMRVSAGTRGMRLRISAVALARALGISETSSDLARVLNRPIFGLPVAPDVARRLLHTANELARELEDDKVASRQACLALLQVISIQLFRLVEPEPDRTVASPQAIVQNFMALVELHIRHHWRHADYARALGVSPDRLMTAVQRATGATPTEIVHHRLIENARQLLSGSSLQVAEVAQALGFRDPAYFNRFFVRHCGLPPGRFRSRAALERKASATSYAAWP